VRFKGLYRTVRRSDHAVPERPPHSLTGKGAPLDIRIWRREGEPLLLVNASRKQDGAVHRNRFRRRVRMAFLELLREMSGEALPCIVWVRPGKGIPRACRLPYTNILDQVRRALNRWDAR
jgi:ribonuclease P protein component